MKAIESPRDYLLRHLSERQRKNPRLSIRHYARLAGVHPSSLSRVLNGERLISTEMALKLGQVLKLSSDEMQDLLDLVSLERAVDSSQQSFFQKKIERRRRITPKQVSLEKFKIVASWEHFAIISLIKTKGFRADPFWIAKRLGLEVSQAHEAVQRLLSTGLAILEGGKLVAVDDGQVETPHDLSAEAIREHHRQHLRRASEALNQVAIEDREFSGVSVVMNPSDIPAVKKRLRAFMDQFNQDFDRPDGGEVFQFNVQFYPLSKMEKTR